MELIASFLCLLKLLFFIQNNNPSFGECELWINKPNPHYLISINVESEILIFLTNLLISQKQILFYMQSTLSECLLVK